MASFAGYRSEEHIDEPETFMTITASPFCSIWSPEELRWTHCSILRTSSAAAARCRSLAEATMARGRKAIRTSPAPSPSTPPTPGAPTAAMAPGTAPPTFTFGAPPAAVPASSSGTAAGIAIPAAAPASAASSSDPAATSTHAPATGPPFPPAPASAAAAGPSVTLAPVASATRATSTTTARAEQREAASRAPQGYPPWDQTLQALDKLSRLFAASCGPAAAGAPPAAQQAGCLLECIEHLAGAVRYWLAKENIKSWDPVGASEELPWRAMTAAESLSGAYARIARVAKRRDSQAWYSRHAPLLLSAVGQLTCAAASLEAAPGVHPATARAAGASGPFPTAPAPVGAPRASEEEGHQPRKEEKGGLQELWAAMGELQAEMAATTAGIQESARSLEALGAGIAGSFSARQGAAKAEDEAACTGRGKDEARGLRPARAEAGTLKTQLNAAQAEAMAARAEAESLRAEVECAHAEASALARSARVAAEASRKRAEEEQGKLRRSLQWWRRTAVEACRERESLLDSLEKRKEAEKDKGTSPGENSSAGAAATAPEGVEVGEEGRVQALEEEVQRLKARLAAYQAAEAAQQRFPLQETSQAPGASTAPLAPSGSLQAQQGMQVKGASPLPGAPPAPQGEAQPVRVHLVCCAQAAPQVGAVRKGLAELSLEDAGAEKGRAQGAGALGGALEVYQGEVAGGRGGNVGQGHVAMAHQDSHVAALEKKLEEMSVTAGLYMRMLRESEAGGREARLEAALGRRKLREAERAAGELGARCAVCLQMVAEAQEGARAARVEAAVAQRAAQEGERKVREMGVTASLYMQMLKEAEAAGREARVEAQLLRRKVLRAEHRLLELSPEKPHPERGPGAGQGASRPGTPRESHEWHGENAGAWKGQLAGPGRATGLLQASQSESLVRRQPAEGEGPPEPEPLVHPSPALCLNVAVAGGTPEPTEAAAAVAAAEWGSIDGGYGSSESWEGPGTAVQCRDVVVEDSVDAAAATAAAAAAAAAAGAAVSGAATTVGDDATVGVEAGVAPAAAGTALEGPAPVMPEAKADAPQRSCERAGSDSDSDSDSGSAHETAPAMASATGAASEGEAPETGLTCPAEPSAAGTAPAEGVTQGLSVALQHEQAEGWATAEEAPALPNPMPLGAPVPATGDEPAPAAAAAVPAPEAVLAAEEAAPMPSQEVAERASGALLDAPEAGDSAKNPPPVLDAPPAPGPAPVTAGEGTASTTESADAMGSPVAEAEAKLAVAAEGAGALPDPVAAGGVARGVPENSIGKGQEPGADPNSAASAGSVQAVQSTAGLESVASDESGTNAESWEVI